MDIWFSGHLTPECGVGLCKTLYTESIGSLSGRERNQKKRERVERDVIEREKHVQSWF